MDETIINILAISILVAPLIGIYITWIHLFKWWLPRRPSKLLKHLTISSAVQDVGVIATTLVAAAVVLDLQIPRILSSLLIGFAFWIGLGVRIWRRFDLKALDSPDKVIPPSSETRDQREDREFGEKRRDLETDHKNEDKK